MHLSHSGFPSREVVLRCSISYVGVTFDDHLLEDLMAHFVDELDHHPSLMDRIGALFHSVNLSATRARELERLAAMSDAQLEVRGLRREDLARHVFRDTMTY